MYKTEIYIFSLIYSSCKARKILPFILLKLVLLINFHQESHASLKFNFQGPKYKRLLLFGQKFSKNHDQYKMPNKLYNFSSVQWLKNKYYSVYHYKKFIL